LRRTSILTDYFWVAKYLPDSNRFSLEPGFNLLMSEMVSHGAYKVIIPSRNSVLGPGDSREWGTLVDPVDLLEETTHGPRLFDKHFDKLSQTLKPISEIVRDLPSTYRKRIVVVDSKSRLYSTVVEYFRPIGNAAPVYLRPCVDRLVDFLYKMKLGIDHQAEVDIDISGGVVSQIQILRQFFKEPSGEVAARLAVVEGIANQYTCDHIMGFSPKSQALRTDVSELVEVVLNEARIEKYSRTRYFLGDPRRMMGALYKVKQIVTEKVLSRKIRSYLQLVSYLISIAFKPLDMDITIPNIGRMKLDGYTPPILNLDETRDLIAFKIYPSKTALFASMTGYWSTHLRGMDLA